MTQAGFHWQVSPEEAFGTGVERYMAAVRVGVEAIANKWAPQIQNWMRANAPWTDRTGNARQTLHTEVMSLTNEVAVMLAHGVTYGIFLEIRNSGRYAIIGPALDEFAPKIWADVKAMLGR